MKNGLNLIGRKIGAGGVSWQLLFVPKCILYMQVENMSQLSRLTRLE